MPYFLRINSYLRAVQSESAEHTESSKLRKSRTHQIVSVCKNSCISELCYVQCKVSCYDARAQFACAATPGSKYLVP